MAGRAATGEMSHILLAMAAVVMMSTKTVPNNRRKATTGNVTNAQPIRTVNFECVAMRRRRPLLVERGRERERAGTGCT